MRRVRNADLIRMTASVSNSFENPRLKAYLPYIEKLNFYRSFLTLLGMDDVFDDVATEIYNALREGLRVREKEYQRVVDSLEWEIEKGLTELILELRETGNDDKADLIDKYLTDRDFGVIYRILLDMVSEEWNTINLYRKIFKFFGEEPRFYEIGGGVYNSLKSKRFVPESVYSKVEEQLSREIHSKIMERISQLRESGYGREADKAEEFLKNGDLENAYHVIMGISEIKKVEYEEVNAKQFMNIYLENFEIINHLSRAGVDVSDILWKLGELLNINSIRLPENKVILVDDPYGNSACFLSIYLKRIGIDFTFFSTTGIGDYWITNIEAENRVSPTLQASNLGERVIESNNLVIIEDINYLVFSNKFSEVYRFLYYIKNSVDNKIIITANLGILSERERARLQSIADAIIRLEFPINICSAGLVAVENRPKEGALLLSKERVDDFNGTVYIISDFGGENTLHPQRIDFEIADKIAEFIDEGDVIIDSLDMLIDENGMDKIYVWLKFVRDIAQIRGKKIYVVTRYLVANERAYIRALFDLDMFLIANIDKKELSKLHRELKAIRRVLDKRVEKECLYTLEIIKHRYKKYKDYLHDLEEEINSIGDIKNYDINCILKLGPIRMKIDKRVEEIETIMADFKEAEERINAQIPIFEVYIDVKELKDCVNNAKFHVSSGEYSIALETIHECERIAKYMLRRATSKAWAKREEIMCVDYLLPPHLKESVAEFEGEREKLRNFTILYVSVKNLLPRKIKQEYEQLKVYSELSGISLFDIKNMIENEEYCKYRKLRDAFMKKFETEKEEIVKSLKHQIQVSTEILESRNYNVRQIMDELKSVDELDALIDLKNRVAHHLVRYVDNYFGNLEERCPSCLPENYKKIINELKNNPVGEIEKLSALLNEVDERLKQEEGRLREIHRELSSYYRIMEDYGVKYEKKYPLNVGAAQKLLEDVRKVIESMTPDIEVNVGDWKVDENRNLVLGILLKNKSKHPAKNITVELHGAVSTKITVDSLEGMKERKVPILGEVRDANAPINIDVVYEGPGGKIATKSFKFEENIKGYITSSATGAEKCALCRGKIFEDNEMVTCTKCGATYHLQCAKRAGKCKICGEVFLF